MLKLFIIVEHIRLIRSKLSRLISRLEHHQSKLESRLGLSRQLIFGQLELGIYRLQLVIVERITMKHHMWQHMKLDQQLQRLRSESLV
jgi:hypothetical protein